MVVVGRLVAKDMYTLYDSESRRAIHLRFRSHGNNLYSILVSGKCGSVMWTVTFSVAKKIPKQKMSEEHCTTTVSQLRDIVSTVLD